MPADSRFPDHVPAPDSGGAPVPDAPAAVPADRPDSPCVAVCSTLFDDVCRGCGRTAMEVANWVFMTDEEKQVVWQRIRAQGYPRRGG